MVNDSVGALHVALAAAVVGWLVFCISHSVAVWNKRNANGQTRRSRGLPYIALLLCAAALAGGWLNRELTRRAGVILGTDFFVVKARENATPHLAKTDSIEDGARLASFDDPSANREEQQLRGEILVLEERIAGTQLKPLALDPEVVRSSQNATDSQRDRLVQLGNGVLRPTPADAVPSQTFAEDERTAAQRARSQAAEMQYQRMTTLVRDGVEAPAKLETARAAAQSAAQDLRERENLIQAAMLGSESVNRAEAAILRDGQRAKAERMAELTELEARLTEYRTSLQQLQSERIIAAPFAGTVVYRNPSPGLVKQGAVILALAKGSGFLANVQVPAHEAAMLEPGQALRLKLQHSLVSEEVTGRLQSVEMVPGYPDRRDLRIECELPPEQFAEFASKPIPVTLQWRPPLYTERITQAGLVFSVMPLAAWLFTWVRSKVAEWPRASARELQQKWSQGWPQSMKEHDLRSLGIPLSEGGGTLADQAAA